MKLIALFPNTFIKIISLYSILYKNLEILPLFSVFETRQYFSFLYHKDLDVSAVNGIVN